MKIELVDVPPRRVIAIDGTGKPGEEEFQEAVQALYSTAFPLRFALRKRGVDHKVEHLEGLWDRDWHWTLFIPLPEEATDAEIERVRIDGVRVDTVSEGQAVEALHVGPYATEPETVAAMDAFAAERGLAQCGPHHEIYLSDPRRTNPEHLRTILRHPVRAGAT